jgi:hypothetical protein
MNESSHSEGGHAANSLAVGLGNFLQKGTFWQNIAKTSGQ